MYEHVLQRGRIGTVELKNRFFKPAAQDFHSHDGYVNQALIDFCSEEAAGGTGLVITGLFNPNPHEADRSGHPSIESDDRIGYLGNLCQAIHDNGAKACLQITHYGSHGDPKDPAYGWRCVSRRGLENEYWYPVLFPEMAGKPYPHKEYTVEEIRELVGNFGDAAYRAKSAGFDMIEIHAANMHGLNTWLTPRTNQRTDAYGGSRENRCRILFEILDDVKAKCGRKFPVTVRLNCEDLVTDPLVPHWSFEDTIWLAHELEARGVSAVNLASLKSGGPMALPMGEVMEYGKRMKEEHLAIPVMICGSMNTPELCEKAVAEGYADFVGQARALYADPAFPRKLREQRPEDIVPCIRCLECMNMNRYSFKSNLVCTMNPQLGKERTLPVGKAERKKKVAVIGGGPAGMEAALVAARRGHTVTLFEKRALGGLVNEAATPCFKADLKRLLSYYPVQLKKAGVEIRMEEASVESMQGFDAAIVATGSKRNALHLPGTDRKNVVNAIDVIAERIQPGKRLVIIGGGSVGVETAIEKAMEGCEVTVVEMMDAIMAHENVSTRMVYLGMLAQNHVRVLTGAALQRITDEGAVVKTKEGREEVLPADTVALSIGLHGDLSLRDALDQVPGLEVYYAGDCEKPGLIFDAVHAGFAAARLI